jgi:catechol 2,3-dioxygenase-like lactoylglutathione lyase family enzyme
MFAHVTIRAEDREASERFYRTVLTAIGIEPTHDTDEIVARDDFATLAAQPGHPSTRHLHVGFVAPSRDHVDAFWQAGVGAGYGDTGEPENLHLAFPAPDQQTVREFHPAATASGYRSNGGPGERAHFGAGYPAACIPDPDGTNVELVFVPRATQTV